MIIELIQLNARNNNSLDFRKSKKRFAAKGSIHKMAESLGADVGSKLLSGTSGSFWSEMSGL